MRTDETGACALAEALLATGMLKESDWCGSVTRSIGAGLTRWVGEVLPQGLSRVPVSLYWTDDLESQSGMDTRLWRSADPDTRSSGEPVGLLALVGSGHPGQTDLFLGQTVLELERVRTGLGFGILLLLHDALTWCVNAGTPFYGYQQTVKRFWLLWRGFSAEELEAADALTPARYRKVVPKEACEPAHDYRKVIRPALGLPAPEHLRPILAAAGKLLDRWTRCEKTLGVDDTSLFATTGRTFILGVPGGSAKEIYVNLRWSPEDPNDRIVDDYHHEIWQRDIQTNLLWSQGWQAGNPAGLRRSAAAWQQLLRIALCGCALAELMHTPEGNATQEGASRV